MDAMSSSGPVEPLAETAALAWAEAPGRCHRDPHTGDTCLWYHRVWQYLRLLGVITSIRTNTDFLIRSFRDYAGTGGYRFALVSATADYSMLAHLKHAYAEEDRPLDATVIDRCDTSLFLNRWYADHYDVSLTTRSGNVLEYVTDRPFDLICTHNFLGRFDHELRRQLISRWHALLRPGGVVVTTQRIRPGSREQRASYRDDEARELSQRVAAIARSHSGLTVDPDELGLAVYQYAIRKGGYVIRSNREITDVFTKQGFDVDVADEGGGQAEQDRDRPSSTAGKDTYRLRIVARKR
jgi:SAM-dependent methyltransferase